MGCNKNMDLFELVIGIEHIHMFNIYLYIHKLKTNYNTTYLNLTSI